MNVKLFKLKSHLAYIIAFSASGTVVADGIERSNADIWHPNPSKLESTAESAEIPLSHENDGNLIVESNGEMTEDVGLLAKESGISYAEAEDAIKAQDEFARYADRLIAKFPNRIARMWKEPAPSTKAHIQFVGKVPNTVLEEVFQNKVPGHVSVTGGGRMSLNEQAKRTQAAGRGLRKAGFVRSLSYYDPSTDSIQLEVKVSEKAARPDRSKILSAVQSELKGTDLRDQLRTITGKELKLKTIRGDGEIMEFDHARGGNWVRLSNNTRWCTSGWSVSGPQGDGIITAAHCNGLTQFEEEGGLVFNMTWRNQVFGNGDVEYHTTNHIELDDFYARAGAANIRDVSGIRSTWTMFGGTVCEYGRSSNTRTCNHTVNGLFVTVNYSIGTVNNLVRVSGDGSIGGDSGGGWSFNYTAWGVHSGSNGSQSYFTPAQLAESVLNVTIKR